MSLALGLAWRFARGSDRRSRILVAIGLVGIAAGMAAMLAGLSVSPALEARDARQARRGMVSGERTSDVLLVRDTGTTFDGRALPIFFVAAKGAAPLPPGLDRLPAPGEIIASPELVEILQGPERALLVERLPGRLGGRVADAGLVEPQELLAYVGATAEELGPGVMAVTRFGRPDPYRLDPGGMAAVAAGTAAVVLSVIVFVWTVTRLGTGSRESRLAALRLLGITPGMVRWIAALEVGITSTAGGLVGLVVFLVARPIVPWSAFLPDQIGLFASDLRPHAAAVVMILVALPILSVGVSWVSLRRVVTRPTEVARRTRVGAAAALLGAAALAAGLGAWLILLADPFAGRGATWARVKDATTLAAWGLTYVGVVGVAPWIGTKGAGLLVRTGATVAWLAARRLEFDRRATGRIAAGVVAVVFAASVSVGILQLFVSDSITVTSAEGLDPATVIATGGIGRTVSQMETIGEIRQVVPVALAQAKVVGAGRVTVAVADCADLGSVLRTAPTCGAQAVIRTLTGQEIPATEFTIRGRGGDPDVSLPIPAGMPGVDLSYTSLLPVLLVDTAALPPALVNRMPYEALAATDGTPFAVERIREALARAGATRVSVTTPSMFETFGQSREAAIARALEWAAFVAVAIAAASLLVALVGAVHERRRPLAMLAAIGVPVTTLRRSFLLQAMAPLLAGVLLAFGCAIVVLIEIAAREFGGAPVLPALVPGLRLSLITMAGGVVAALLTLPVIGRSIGPETLRTE